MNHKKKCPECGSNELEWTHVFINTGNTMDGRLRLHEIDVKFICSCSSCSETINIMSIDQVTEIISMF